MPATRMTLGITSLVVVLAGALDARAGAPPLTNTIEQVGSFPRNGRLYTARCAINDRGDIGGEFKGSRTPDTIWHRTASGVETHLDVGGDHHRFGGINENGEIVFTTRKAGFSPWEPVALYRYRPGSGAELLMDSVEVPFNIFGYNNAGQTAGERASLVVNGMRALRFDPGVGFVDLGGPIPSSTQQGRAINAWGQVGANINWSGGRGSAAVHTPGVGWRTLGALGSGNTEVRAINDLGDIVGYSHTASVVTDFEAFVVFAGGHMQALGVLPGDDHSAADDINNNQWVIGESGNTRPFLWTQATGLIDLQTLVPAGSGWTIQSVDDINNNGQIVGAGRIEGISGLFPFVLTIRTLEPSNPADARSAPPMHADALRAVLTNYGQVGESLVGDVNADGAIDAMDLRAVVEGRSAGRGGEPARAEARGSD